MTGLEPIYLQTLALSFSFLAVSMGLMFLTEAFFIAKNS